MISTINIDKFNSGSYLSAIVEIKSTILSLKDNYPNIKQWFRNKVEPGIVSGNRSIILAKSGENIVGFTILKNDMKEKKICTFYVYPEFRGFGVANDLFAESFNTLGTTKPLMTIPQNKIAEFSKYMNKFNFELVKSDFIYQNNTKELVFNESL